MDEYIEGEKHCYSFRGKKDALIDTWDRPEEDIPPERTDEELESMLLKGECTIDYANNPKDVQHMCLLCSKEECRGPYDEDHWERYLPGAEIGRMPKRPRDLHRSMKMEGKRVKWYRAKAIFLIEYVTASRKMGYPVFSSESNRVEMLLKRFGRMRVR